MSEGRDEVIESYQKIAEALSEAMGGPALSGDAAYRLATRPRDPLPVEGYAGRSWIRRSALVEWAERNRVKARQREESPQVAFPFPLAQKPR